MREALQRVALLLTMFVIWTSAPAAELASGVIAGEAGGEVAFRLSGNSREDLVGGTIELDSRSFAISRVSRHGLVGASGPVAGDAGSNALEFLVFSSSFGAQTAVGRPWVAARGHTGCDSQYNSFLAVYRVQGEKAVKALGPIPYPQLVEDTALSQTSHVYCFMVTTN